MVVKLSSASTILEAACATAVPEPMATPISAALSAGASLTPSPVMAHTSPGPPSSSDFCKHLTISCLWIGSVREKRLAERTASIRLRAFIAWNSAPVKDLPASFSLGPKTPIMRQMASAVFWLSPVMTTTRMPADWHFSIAALTSTLGGSRMPATPTKMRSLSTSANFLGSLRRLSVLSTPSL